jgi:hypothetical protein
MPIEMYGRSWPEGSSRLQIELTCYRYADKWGLDRLKHCKAAFSLLYPELRDTYFSWTEWILKGLCEESKTGTGFLSILGASGTGKSLTVGYWVVLDWLADPENTITLASSTTIADLNNRIWKYIRKSYQGLGYDVGKLRLSKPEAILSDTLQGGIYAIALNNDPDGQSLAGFHPKRLRIIVDEATAISPGLLAYRENWAAAGKESMLVTMSNFRGFDNLCATVSEPVDGWGSIDYESTTWWKSKVGGQVILLDGLKSPVYVRPELETKLPFLRKKRDIDAAIMNMGDKHPRVMQFIRSIPVFDEGKKTVLTRRKILDSGAEERVRWAGLGQTKLLALDPAFVTGGDSAVLQPGIMGWDTEGRQVIELGTPIYIPISSASVKPVEYQILEFVVKHCEKEGIKPEHFVLDGAGQGRGLGSIFQWEWSDKVLVIQPGYSATERMVDWDLQKTAKELYDRFVTELWFETRRYVESGQIRNFVGAAAAQFCNRLYEDSKVKIRLETKREYKARMFGEEATKGSPDEGDSVSYLIHLAQEAGLTYMAKVPAWGNVGIEDWRTKQHRAVAEWVSEKEKAWEESLQVKSETGMSLEMEYDGGVISDD